MGRTSRIRHGERKTNFKRWTAFEPLSCIRFVRLDLPKIMTNTILLAILVGLVAGSLIGTLGAQLALVFLEDQIYGFLDRCELWINKKLGRK